MIGHHTRLKEDDDLPCRPLGSPASRQKPQCFNVRALLLVKNMRSKDAHQAKGRCHQHPTPAAPGIDTKSNHFFPCRHRRAFHLNDDMYKTNYNLTNQRHYPVLLWVNSNDTLRTWGIIRLCNRLSIKRKSIACEA